MSGYSFLIAIIQRDYGEEYIDFLKRNNVAAVFGSLCEGAARAKTLDLLGLEKKEKVLLACVAPGKTARLILRRIVSEMRIDAPNTGIALSVPVDGIGGASGLHYLCGGETIEKDEVRTMKDMPYSLVVAIVDRGHTGIVMDAAREAGASGGTIIRTKEICSGTAAKFFGVNIAEERDMVYIVTKHSQRDTILKAIMGKAGINSPAHTVAFSLPVEAIAGLRGDDEE